jgi:uncharacterized damage-inducible protein DinB
MNLEALNVQLGYVAAVMKMNVADLSQEESLIRPGPGGNCVNWVVGHIMSSRNKMLRLVGKEPIWSEAEEALYDRGSESMTDPARALPLERMLADFEASQRPILDGLAAMTPEQLSAKAPFSPGNNKNETIGSLLAGLVFHESYHIGQTGVLRRIAGKEAAIR